MRLLTIILSACLTAGLCPRSACAQHTTPAPAAGEAEPATIELIEDLRILSILNVLQPTRDQSTKLAVVAVAGRDGLAAIGAEVKARLDQQRDRLLAAREKVLRGGATPQTTDAQLVGAGQAAQASRAQKTETLVITLTGRVRRILTPEQAAQIENDLAPSLDQPWRQYSRVLTAPAASSRANNRMPSDPGKWLRELRDLRVDSAEGDPAFEVEDFARKLTTGLRGGTPLFDQSFAQARGFATQVLGMSPDVFAQREIELARMAAKQERDTRNQQRAADGKPVETFDPDRWFVEEVVLSPRAATDFRDRASVP